MFEYRLMRIFGHTKEEVGRSWRRLHNEKLHRPYVTKNIIRVIKSRGMRLVGIIARMGHEKFIQTLVGKHEGKRQIGRPRRRWEDNVTMPLFSKWEDLYWINLAEIRDQWRALVNKFMKLRVP
jgi:hypothetical protein